MPELTTEQLIAGCQQFVQQQQQQQEQQQPEPEPEWTGHLHITPHIVAEILDSNKEE